MITLRTKGINDKFVSPPALEVAFPGNEGSSIKPCKQINFLATLTHNYERPIDDQQNAVEGKNARRCQREKFSNNQLPLWRWLCVPEISKYF